MEEGGWGVIVESGVGPLERGVGSGVEVKRR